MVALATGIFFSNNIEADQNLDMAALIAINSANAENGKYSGPLCGDASGTRYCCKDSDPSDDCAAGSKCSSCQ